MSVHQAIHALRRGRSAVRVALHVVVPAVLLFWCLLPSARAQFTRFQNLTDEQGLGNLTVYALAQDRDGYLLIGTEAGLYRYDGVGITADDAGLPSASWIQQIVSDETGRVWIVTADGLYVRQGAGFSRVDIGTSAHLQSAHLLAVTATRVALDAGGTLLAAPVGAGIVGRFSPLFDAATLARVPELARARFVSPDTGGGLLIGCGVSICREAGNRVAVLGDADGLPADTWQVAIRTPDGTLWARSLDRIAWRRPGRARFEVAVLPGGRDPGVAGFGEHTSYVAHPERLGLLDDRHGGVLTQSAGGLIDWNGTTWRMYAHHAGGLPTNRLQAFMFDREGSLWVGSFGTGVFRSIGMDSWEHWTADDVLPSNIVWSMTRLANRTLWVATDSGTVAIGSAASGISAETNYVAQATAAGRVWLAPVGAPLTRIDPARNVVERFASVGRVVTADIDRTGRLWLCTPGGLFMVAQPDAPAPDVHPELVLAHDVQQVTTDPSGAVWALSADGVFRQDASGRFHLVVPPALLRSAPFALTFTPGGELWVGTGSTGVLRFRVTGSQVEPLSSLVSPVIGSNNILFARRDRRGWIWLGSDHGIDMFDGRSWRRFDGSDGPITNDMNQAAVYEDADGSMWFGTSHGLSHLVDPTARPPPAILHPLVTGLSFDNRSLALAPSIRTHWSAASLIIRFVDLDYTHGHNIAFRYRLDGLDSGWSSTTEHEVRYAGLPPGTLRFELVAVDTVHGRASALHHPHPRALVAALVVLRAVRPGRDRHPGRGLAGPDPVAASPEAAPRAPGGRPHRRDRGGTARAAAPGAVGCLDRPREPPRDHGRAGAGGRCGPAHGSAACRAPVRHRPLQEDQRLLRPSGGRPGAHRLRCQAGRCHQPAGSGGSLWRRGVPSHPARRAGRRAAQRVRHPPRHSRRALCRRRPGPAGDVERGAGLSSCRGQRAVAGRARGRSPLPGKGERAEPDRG